MGWQIQSEIKTQNAGQSIPKQLYNNKDISNKKAYFILKKKTTCYGTNRYHFHESYNKILKIIKIKVKFSAFQCKKFKVKKKIIRMHPINLVFKK